MVITPNKFILFTLWVIMKINVDSYYSKYTNDFTEHEVEGATVADGFRVLCNRYPQLLVQLQDNDFALCYQSGVRLNGEFLVDPASHEVEVRPTDTLDLTREIPAGNDKVIKYIAGAVLIVVGAVLVYTGYGAGLGQSMIQVGVSLILSTAVISAFFTPSAPSQINSFLNNSATYSFEGVCNTTATGTPTAVVYGAHRVGGQVLNMFTTSEDTVETINGLDVAVTSSYLYAQIGICEGEIADCTDVQVNQLPRNFYNEIVTAPEQDWLRLGTSDQTTMPAFTTIQNTTSINRKVMAIPDINLINTPIVFASYQTMYGIMELTDWGKTKTYKPGLYKLQYNYYEDAYYDYGGGA